jgi:hypothetical protein
LLIVGSVARDEVERFKRTRQYSVEDFDLLKTFITGFELLVATPNVLTEVSNLLGGLREHLRIMAGAYLGESVKSLSEQYVESQEVVAEPDYLRLGLTDVGIALLSREDMLVLTDDLDLYVKLSSDKTEVINFRHLRAGSWGF